MARKKLKIITADGLAQSPEIRKDLKDSILAAAEAERRNPIGLLDAAEPRPTQRPGFSAFKLEDLAQKMGRSLKSTRREVQRKGLQREAVGGKTWVFFPTD